MIIKKVTQREEHTNITKETGINQSTTVIKIIIIQLTKKKKKKKKLNRVEEYFFLLLNGLLRHIYTERERV